MFINEAHITYNPRHDRLRYVTQDLDGKDVKHIKE